MGIIKDKLQNIVDNHESVRYGDTIAKIISYNDINSTASIHFVNPNNGAIVEADNVIVKIDTGGFSKAALSVGQKCIVSFIGNSILTPIITSLCDDSYFDNFYQRRTNADQGAYLINNKINELNISDINISPMINDYLNNESTKQKYSLISEDYLNTDSIAEARDILIRIDKYKPSEEGITNIKTKSTIKFKENGDIDIFVNNNTGIRIDPNNKNISFFSKSMNTTLLNDWTINGNVKINGKLFINDNEVK